MAEHCYAECHLCWEPQISPLCRVSLCLMLLCWVSLMLSVTYKPIRLSVVMLSIVLPIVLMSSFTYADSHKSCMLRIVMPSVIILSAVMLSVVILSVVMLSFTYAEFHLCWVSLVLSVTYKPSMLNVVMLNVVLLNVLAALGTISATAVEIIKNGKWLWMIYLFLFQKNFFFFSKKNCQRIKDISRSWDIKLFTVVSTITVL
jgi:hypothetical protein